MEKIFNKKNLSNNEKELLLDGLLYYKSQLLLENYKEEIKTGKAYGRSNVVFLNKVIEELKESEVD